MFYTIFGASGFIARYIIERLVSSKNNTIYVVTRNKNRVKHLKVLGHHGQIVIIEYTNNELPYYIIKKSDMVINTIGSFSKDHLFKTHSQIPEEIAQECANNKIKKFIHFSSLGIENNPSLYARSKINGERAVLAALPNATIIRPSLVFGMENKKIASLYRIAQHLFLPLIKTNTYFQPISIEDVTEFVLMVLSSEYNVSGIQEIAGPREYTTKELMEKLINNPIKKHIPISISYRLIKIITYILQIFTNNPILSIDQLLLLHNNSFTTGNNALIKYNITPKYIEGMINKYE